MVGKPFEGVQLATKQINEMAESTADRLLIIEDDERSPSRRFGG